MVTVSKPISNRQEFLTECQEWCEKFKADNLVKIVYVRKGRKPTKINVEKDGVKTTKFRLPRKGERGKPVGIVASYTGKDGVTRVGWSLCKKNERFSPVIGLRYALERAIPVEEAKDMLNQIKAISQTLKDFEGQTSIDGLWKENFPPRSTVRTLAWFLQSK